jgi:anti-sigma factor RsiW
MKTFEERWTEWLDGELHGNELAEFEAALPDRAAAEAERRDVQKLKGLLQQYAVAPAMGNEEFFHHQLRESIAREQRPQPKRDRTSWWSIPRLVLAGATSLAVFAVCTLLVLRENPQAGHSQYLTQVLNARVDPTVSPDATISMFETKDQKVTVLWVDGLKSLPSEYAAK